MTTKLYTLQEVADILHVTRKTIYNYIDSGLLTPVELKSTREGMKPMKRLRKSNGCSSLYHQHKNGSRNGK